ncbi:MAG: transcription-repair coupling factor [Treponema sp.]|nr:MAG: transcription-repair coupling factor [Treponema sp.]
MITAKKNIAQCNFPYSVYGLEGGAFSFFLHELMKTVKGKVLIVVPTENDTNTTLADIETAGYTASVLPWWGSLAYRPIQKNASVFSERAKTLCNIALTKNEHSILVMSERAFLTPVPKPNYVKELSCNFALGDEIKLTEVSEKLAKIGYMRVPRVTMRGEFAVRGDVLDICPAAESSKENAFRIQLDFDKIEKIKLFNMFSQSSMNYKNQNNNLNAILIPPAKEVIWDKERIETLRENLNQYNEFTENSFKLIDTLEQFGEFEGEEIFYPICFQKEFSIIDYLDKNDIIIYTNYERLKNADETLLREYTGLYKKAKTALDENEKRKTLLAEFPKPERLIFKFSELSEKFRQSIFLKTFSQATADKTNTNPENKINFSFEVARSFFGNIVYLKEELTALQKDNWKIYIFAESENQSARINSVLQDFDLEILPFNLSSGFGVPKLKLLVIHENEIFGRRRRIPKSVKHAKSSVIDAFIELNPGDYVVHINYGIGRFKGIERVEAMGNERDYINLLYANDETIFIPIEQADLVQRYIGNEGEAPRLDTIGSKAWENRKSKVKKSVEDIAEKLLELYSKRKAAKGFVFPPDDEWQLAFEAAFPYEETRDQLTCIAEVKEDMQKKEPMDRLICGDVGYGKTEVSMRAAFKAVMAGKQVAFLAPTTILAEQHYETLSRRFKKFPVKVNKLSRFVSKAKQKETLKNLEIGKVDILIGTHRIIQKDVKFKDLGLMIIDEEQRFGVKDKERLKQMKANVDCLSMSATPIPRTLHMSLLKIRNMSVITTPPQNRRPVETHISEFNLDLIAKAIRYEVERGGQIFYLHNRVDTLEDTLFMLRKLLPEILFSIAHGRMPADELEDIFHRFNLGGFHVLISTTIIENGIDIPNANTIIIDRADMYGVSQLYQLRGRVGRSNQKAFAYLFYPKEKALSEIAMKRLQTISDFTELGSGFKIAMKDMEIRGAGNLLGKEQSGNIYSVGFDLYLHLLEEAVQKLENNNYIPEQESIIELEYTGFIPDEYISVQETKMEVYKKIAGVRTNHELDNVISELSDRFGNPPEEVESLLALAEIKIICKELSIASLKERAGRVRIEFAKVAKISIDKLLRLIKESDGRIHLDPQAPNILVLETGMIGLKEKSEFIREKLGKFI